MTGIRELRHSKAQIAGVLVVGLSVSAQAADLSPTLKVAPTTLQSPTTITAPITITAIPQVTGFQPTGCVGKGATVTIQGKNFGTQTGKAVALGGSGIHVDLTVSSWGASSIVATIPNDTRIQAGQWYYIGVEKTGHAQWLSNIDKNITICATTALTAGQIAPTVRVAPTLALPIGGGTPAGDGASAGAPAPAPVAAEPVDAGIGTGVDTSDGSASRGAASAPPPSSAGSLLQTRLPPLPQNLPPVPAKQDASIEPGELVVVSASLDEAQALAAEAHALGLGVKRRTRFRGLGFVVTVLRVPKDASVGDALVALRPHLPQVWADANHRYGLMAGEAKYEAAALMGWQATPGCGTGLAIGMIDTRIDADHPVLRGRKLAARSFLAAGLAPAPPAHGTATAALLVGEGEVAGLVPGAKLLVADVFRQRGKDTDTTADTLVQALDWLVTERVAVINLSLGGPRNLIVEAAVQRVLDAGVAVVAAAGNGGPDAPPVYPAAQDGVIAVTAVDMKLKPYRRANRGDYIGFAAPGVDVPTAAPGGGLVYVSGTSYAAPFVTAALALARPSRQGKPDWGVVHQRLRDSARDLGAPGKDTVFGWGLARAPGCAKAVARE